MKLGYLEKLLSNQATQPGPLPALVSGLHVVRGLVEAHVRLAADAASAAAAAPLAQAADAVLMPPPQAPACPSFVHGPQVRWGPGGRVQEVHRDTTMKFDLPYSAIECAQPLSAYAYCLDCL